MKRIAALLFVFILMLAGVTVWAYEPPMLNMKTPTGLGENQLDFTIMHRFLGNVGAGESPVGSGANVAFRFRYMPPVPGLEFEAEYTAYGNEISAGASYARSIPAIPVTGQLFAQFYNVSVEEARVSGGYGSLSLQSDPIFDRVHLRGSVGYDTHFNRVNAGGGLVVDVLPSLSLIGEYFPLFGGDDAGRRGDVGAYAAGFSIDTVGHHFTILATNRFDIGEHWQAGGGFGGSLYFGFNLQRLFWL